MEEMNPLEPKKNRPIMRGGFYQVPRSIYSRLAYGVAYCNVYFPIGTNLMMFTEFRGSVTVTLPETTPSSSFFGVTTSL